MPEKTSEAEILKALRNLPISIQIVERSNGYVFQVMEHSGIAHTLADAISLSMNFLIGRLAGANIEKMRDKYELPEHKK